MATTSTVQTHSRHPIGLLLVADLARRAHVTPATIRYYARIGLLKPGRDGHNGYRRFTGHDLRRVVFIRKAQALGLTIGDIRSILDAIERGQSACDLVVDLVRERLDEIRRQCAELQETKARIECALEQWAFADHDGVGSDLCPLIERATIGQRAGAPGEQVRMRLRAAGGPYNGPLHPAAASAR